MAPADSPARLLEALTPASGAGVAAAAAEAVATMQVLVSCSWNSNLLGLQSLACEEMLVEGYGLTSRSTCEGFHLSMLTPFVVPLEGPESIQLWTPSVEPGGHACTLMWP